MSHSYTECDNRKKSVTLNIFHGTWNVNGKPPTANMADWLIPKNSPCEYDIYALAFQEVQTLSGFGAIITNPRKGNRWVKKIQDILGGPSKYLCLGAKQMVGIVLAVFVKISHVPYITNFSTKVQGTGLLNCLGNKGAVIARFDLYGKSVCCVGCHLASHKHNIKGRDKDFNDVMKYTQFNVSQMSATKGINNRFMKIMDHDIVFWTGDLNYRIDLSNKEVLDLICQKDWVALNEFDQLNRLRKTGVVFQEFEEKNLTFAPTYKKNINGDGYATDQKGNIKRTPAWTDRILWRIKDGIDTVAIVQGDYLTYDVYLSDHLPVWSTFRLHIKIPETLPLLTMAALPIISSTFYNIKQHNDQTMKCVTRVSVQCRAHQISSSFGMTPILSQHHSLKPIRAFYSRNGLNYNFALRRDDNNFSGICEELKSEYYFKKISYTEIQRKIIQQDLRAELSVLFQVFLFVFQSSLRNPMYSLG